LLRTFLKSRNLTPYGWTLGRNLGRQSHPKTGCGEEVIARLKQIYHKHGQKVSIIGWSLGGIYARELARIHPEMVRQVITLGSPFSQSLKANRASKLFEKTSGYSLHDMDLELRKNMKFSPPVPTTSVYSRSDGITAWQCCLEIPDETTQNIEVVSSHCGLGHHPFVMWVIADRLAQAEDNWQLFKPKFLEKLMFL
jgi:pimeloyl-ACP methyl ester carboxylesterase